MPQRRVPPRAWLLGLLFFATGFASLVYEISWSRQIGLLFGHTVHAAAIVLAAYMAGLAAGYALAGRLPGVRPLRGYGFAELFAAAWALCIPLLLQQAEAGGLVMLLSSSHPWLQSALRFAFCFLLLLPATTALGATLPFMAEQLATERGPAGRRTTLFYGLNTCGALLGVAAALAFLLILVGVRGSSWLAAGISAGCGLAALFLARGPVTRSAPKDAGPPPGPAARVWTVVVILTGFSVMGLEIAYTRAFALVFHNSTYTFGLVVGAVLGGLAAGALLISRSRRQVERRAVQASAAAALLVSLSPGVFLAAGGLDYFACGTSFSSYMLGAAGLVALVVLPPITALGALLPASWRVLGGAEGTRGRLVGQLTMRSTLAGVAGALLTGFFFLPLLGLWGSFALLTGLVLLAAALLMRRAQRPALGLALLLSGALAGGGSSLIFLLRMSDEALARGAGILQRWEGPYGWTDLERQAHTGALAIVQNLHYNLGSTRPMARELWQGDLPLLLHPAPAQVLFMGMGTGITASAALDHDEVERVVVVELIPEVVQAARQLGQHNAELAQDPRVQLRIDDARHVLQRREARYDVLVSDLFVPWESGSGYLYTVEHYESVRENLAPAGIFCQWIALYQLGRPELERIADSFATVFPTTTLWWGDSGQRWPIVCLLGSAEPLQLDAAVLQARLRSLDARQSPRITMSASPLDLHLGTWRILHPNQLNTDEHPWIEFRAPVAFRDARLLQDDLLLSYHERVLSRLSRDGVIVRQRGQPVPLPGIRDPG